MKNSLILAFVLLLSSSAWAENVCDGAKPKTLEESNSADPEFPEKQSQSIQFDLDGDGEKEFFESAGCGTGFCNFVIYKKDRKNKSVFNCVGGLDVHPKAFEVLRVKHHGYPDLLAYYHNNVSSGALNRLEFNGHEYKVVAELTGQSKLFDLIHPSYNEP